VKWLLFLVVVDFRDPVYAADMGPIVLSVLYFLYNSLLLAAEETFDIFRF